MRTKGPRQMVRRASLFVCTVVILLWAFLGSRLFPNALRDHYSSASQIIVGVSNVQSGPSRYLGQNLMRGAAAYFDLLNVQGGIYGRKITILLKDDRYEPDPAIENTNELIENGKALFLFDYVGT